MISIIQHQKDDPLISMLTQKGLKCHHAIPCPKWKGFYIKRDRFNMKYIYIDIKMSNDVKEQFSG